MTDRHDGLPELRAEFEAAVRAQHPAVATVGARLTLRRDMPGSTRFGQYVAEPIEFSWEMWQAAYSAGQRAAAVRAAELCEAQMDLAEAAEADKRAHDALKSSDESRQLSRLKHASVVSLYNAAMRNCAAAILREFGIDKEQA